MNEVFRKEALERMRSPESVDDLMVVIRPRDWLVLLSFSILIVLATCWSIFGRLPVTVTGRGVLILPRKVVNIQAPASGRLAELGVQVGDHIKRGDILGIIDQADVRQLLQEEQQKLQELLKQDQTKSNLQAQQATLRAQQTALKNRAIALRQSDLKKRLRDATAKVPLLKQRMTSRQELEKRGLLSRLSEERLQAEQAYLENQDTIAGLKSQLQQLESDLKQLEGEAKSLVLQDVETATSRQNTIGEVRSRIAFYEGRLARQGRIVSDRDGHVLEITVNIGQQVTKGMRLGSMQVTSRSSHLMGLSYFPIQVGKKIRAGMPIQIVPDTVERGRYGNLLGTVVTVSDFPVTQAGIESLVGNPAVASTLSAQGVPIEVRAQLKPDPSTFSQYKWSSSNGPPLTMTSGTTTTARVVIEHRAPITYVLPFLREISGVY